MVDERITALRRLLYCGEWISSHTLHMFFLHAPDFLGYQDVIAMARDHQGPVEMALRLKKAGNAILSTVGGRAIHPVNPRVGGFHRAPTKAELAPLAEQLRSALDDAVAALDWVSTLEFPDLELEHDLLAVHHPDHYAIEGGDIRSSRGLIMQVSEFSEHVVEHHAPHSTALHATLDGRRYLTGPLARYSLNGAQLSPIARDAAARVGLGDTCRNPFRSILVRGVENIYAIDEALRLIADYERPDPPAFDVPPRAGTGHGVSEAPRGLLYHRYELDADGLITSATIVPPTSQNQPAIEDDLRRVASANLHLDDVGPDRTVRADDPQLRPVHLVLDPLPRPHHRTPVSARVAVIGVGNAYRRDDGVGLIVAAAVALAARPGVTVTSTDGDPAAILDAWAGADLAVIVDAARFTPSAPGRIHRTSADGLSAAGLTSSHGFGVAQALRLGAVLGNVPPRVVVLAVEVQDIGFGPGLSDAVAAAVEPLTCAVLSELVSPDCEYPQEPAIATLT